MKKLGKILLKLWNKPLTKVIVYAVVLFLILTISSNSSKDQTLWEKLVAILTSNETISFFSAGIITIIIVTIGSHVEDRLEESLKIEDDHRKIILKYKKHEKKKLDEENINFYDKKGVFMELHHTIKNQKVKNNIKDIYSKEYKEVEEILNLYKEYDVILLPSVNVFTNREKNIKLSFDDSLTEKQLPDFVIVNAQEFMEAHKYSNTSNNITIRLDDFDFQDNKLTLHTSRTYYYHMLLTNRCMDYQIKSGMSIRGLYEFKDSVTPLKDSKLSNQIGINGMIITTDGYVLLEKRGRNKTTWKNKFAQPISLALKESDLKLDDTRLLNSDCEYSNKKMMNVIKETMKSNFGLLEEDYETLSVENNLLGIARDLLEGGKPNLYFVVTVKYNHLEFLEVLKQKAGNIEKNVLKKEKLESDYYLIDYNDIRINLEYELKVKKNKVFKVQRLVYPRSKKRLERKELRKYKVSKFFKPYLDFGCGEALLVSLSYLEICQPTIEALNTKEVSR